MRFVSEVACLNGNYCVDTFLDLDKSYDSIDNVKLSRQASQLKWDPVVLCMSLFVHLSPRVLRIGDLWGEWIQPCNSILQGCGSSNSWARASLYNLLQDLHSRFPVQIGQQVDENKRHSHGTFFQALHWSVEAICTLDRGLSGLGLALSQNKSTVIASHPRLLRAVRRELLEQGISFEGGNSVRDVGLDATAGQRRSVKIQNRSTQPSDCSRRVFFPALAFGHAGTGACPSFPPHKRAMAAESCGRKIKTACPTTLHFHLGETGDPAMWFSLGQPRTWLELQSEDLEHRLDRVDVARAWAAASGNMRKDSRWSMVKGPLTATMATFRDLNIIPATPWKWYLIEDPDVDWTYSGADPGPFLREMQQRLSRKVWKQAAQHNHGEGAENGVDMTVLRKHHKQLVRQHAHTRAGMLYKLATAQIYDGPRVCEHNPAEAR